MKVLKLLMNILIIIFLLVLSLISALVIYYFHIPNAVNSEHQKIIFHGLVLNKYKKDKNNGILLIGDSIKQMSVDVCLPIRKKEDLWEFVIVGDSIYKNVGEKVQIIRSGQSYEFQFPSCLY